MSGAPPAQRTHLGVYALIERDGAFLLVEKTRGPYTGLLDLPGGSPEFGETFEDALVRELAEEVALHIRADDLTLCDAIAFTLPDGGTTLCHRAVIYRVNIIAAARAAHCSDAAVVSSDTAGSTWARPDSPRLSALAAQALRRSLHRAETVSRATT